MATVSPDLPSAPRPVDVYGAHHRPLCPEGRAGHLVDPPETVPCDPKVRPFVLAATIMASAMAFIDGSVVTIALPVLQKDLGASFGAIQWVVNAYALFLGTLILVGGVCGDIYGRRRVFIIGIHIFALASVFCAAAPTTGSLIAARGLQGIGAALLVPQSLALIAANFPKDVRGRAIGLWAGASAITTALGPLVGGLMIDWFSWRSIFWINFPISLMVLFLTHRYIPEGRDLARHVTPDWLGAVLALIGFGGLTVGLTLASESGVSSTSALLVGVGAVALLLFWRVEIWWSHPLVPFDLFADRTFLVTNVMTVFLYGALAALLFLLPFELIDRRGLSPSEVGTTLLPLGLIIGLFSRAAGRWSDRIGPRVPLAAGSVIVAASAAILALALHDFWLGVAVPILVMATGMAMVVSPLTTAAINSAPDAKAGAASGINNAASRVGGLWAIVLLGAIANFVFVHELSMVGLPDTAFADAQVSFGDLPPVGSTGRAVLEIAFGRAYAVGMGFVSLLALSSGAIAYIYLPREPSEKIAVS